MSNVNQNKCQLHVENEKLGHFQSQMSHNAIWSHTVELYSAFAYYSTIVAE